MDKTESKITGSDPHNPNRTLGDITQGTPESEKKKSNVDVSLYYMLSVFCAIKLKVKPFSSVGIWVILLRTIYSATHKKFSTKKRKQL